MTKYGHTLPKAAVDTLQKYKDYLTFGQGEGGMLAGTFFFMVSAETFANADSLQKVMGKYQEMAKVYNSPADIMNIANTIAKVYVDNYDNYLKEVYPQAKKDMAVSWQGEGTRRVSSGPDWTVWQTLCLPWQ